MTAKPKRARTERREAQRALRKQVVKAERLAAAGPGGSRDRAIPVSSASVIEIRAAAVRCVQCGSETEIRSHAAAPDGGGVLRVVHLVCRLCHAPRDVWFKVEPPLPS